MTAPRKVQATVRKRAEAIKPDNPRLSITKQCEIMGVSRSAYHYRPGHTDDELEIAILKAILDVLGIRPFYGYRKVAQQLADIGVTRKQVRRIMNRAGLRAIYAAGERGCHRSITGSIRTSCGARTYGCRIKSGLLTSRTSSLQEDMCTWWRSSTSIRGRYCRGRFQIRFMRNSASRLLKKPSRSTACRRSSTRIRVVSSHRKLSLPRSTAMAYGSAWTVSIVPWTISTSSDSGGR